MVYFAANKGFTMDKIVLKNMAFYGYHGNLESEKSQGQRFFVDVEIKTDLT